MAVLLCCQYRECLCGCQGVVGIRIYEINVFGDAVRDLLDPRLRGSGS